MLTDKQETIAILEILKEMGDKHFQRAKKAGIPLTFKEQGNLVCLHPDGRKEIIKKFKQIAKLPKQYTLK